MLWQLYLSFAKVGALTFGGGYAMLPILQREVVDNKGWITTEEALDYYSVSQCLPGIIAVNTSLFIGHKMKGKAGGICAALGIVTPSLVIIMVIAAFLQNFIHYPIVQNAFYGVRIVVCALILSAIVKLFRPAVKDGFTAFLYLLTLFLGLFTSIPTWLLVVLAVLAGIVGSRVLHKGDGA